MRVYSRNFTMNHSIILVCPEALRGAVLIFYRSIAVNCYHGSLVIIHCCVT